MSTQGILGIILSLLMAFSSILAPGTYQEVTISDPVFTVPTSHMVTSQDDEGNTHYDWETTETTYDLTGLSLSLGLGANEEDTQGVIRAAAQAGQGKLSGLASVADGKALIFVDGLSKLITCDVPTEDQLEQLIVSMAEGQLPEGAVDFDQLRRALRGANAEISQEAALETAQKLAARVEEYFGEIEFESVTQTESTETFINGEITKDVTRTDFSLTAEQTQTLLRQAMGFVQAVLADANPLLAGSMNGSFDETPMSAAGPTKGTLYTGDGLTAIDLTVSQLPKEEGGEADTARLYAVMCMEGNDFRLYLTGSEDDQEPEFVLDVVGNAAFEGENGAMTMTATLNGQQLLTYAATVQDGTTTTDIVVTPPADLDESFLDEVDLSDLAEEDADEFYDALEDELAGYASSITVHSVVTQTEGGMDVTVNMVNSSSSSEDYINNYTDFTLSSQWEGACKFDAALTVRTEDSYMLADALQAVATLRLSYDGEVTEENGTKTVSGPLNFSLDAMGQTMTFSCGVALKTAPLDGYLVTDLPQDMERVDFSELTEDDMAELQNAVMSFAMSAASIPGVQALMTQR